MRQAKETHQEKPLILKNTLKGGSEYLDIERRGHSEKTRLTSPPR